MKVYCKNCEYLQYRWRAGNEALSVKPKMLLFCNSMGNQHLSWTGYNSFQGDHYNNKDLRCKNYKRKWWKFWVKPKTG